MSPSIAAVRGESICPYCGVGCRLRPRRRGRPHSATLKVRGVADAPANLGRHLRQGRAARRDHRHARPADASRMLRRLAARAVPPGDWDAALSHVARTLPATSSHAHGPDARRVLRQRASSTPSRSTSPASCSRATWHEQHRLQQPAVHGRAVAGYRTSLGSDGPPCCYDDIDLADVIFIIGSNMAEAHPVTFDRIKAAKAARPSLTIIVVDPRRTRDGEGGRPPPAGRARRRHRPAQRPGPHAARLRRRRRPSSPTTPRLRRVPRLPPRPVPRRCPWRRAGWIAC